MIEIKSTFKVVEQIHSSNARYATAKKGDLITLSYPIERKYNGEEIKVYVNDEYTAFINPYEAIRLTKIYKLEPIE